MLERPAPFSVLPGMARLLMVLDPIVIEVGILNNRRTLRQRDIIAFAGGDPVGLVALDQPGRVLNLMCREELWVPSIDRCAGEPFGWITFPSGDLVLGPRPSPSAIGIDFSGIEELTRIG
jgi:environmental stress-induced protein Ves